MSAIVPRTATQEASGPPDAADFVATSKAVDPSTWSMRSAEILAEAADRGVLVAGRERLLATTGVAATLPLPRGLEDERALREVRAWLAAVEHLTADVDERAEGAPGPIALGAFAFDRASPAQLVVPSLAWCRDADGRTWRVGIHRRDATGADSVQDGRRRADDAGTTSAQLSGPSSPAHAQDAIRIDQEPSGDEYADAVAQAVTDIRAGRLSKVVLARLVVLHLPTTAVPSRVLATLWHGDRAFSPFSVPIPTGRLVGASPELVIGRRGRTVTSHAFAGTVPLTEPDGTGRTSASDLPRERRATDGADRLFHSTKDRIEQRLVVDEIVHALESRCVALSVPAEPTVVRLRSDARLGTVIGGTLTRTASEGDTALTLLALLHPTPAVGGVTRAAALERISALEPAARGYWAGAVGWTDRSGDGEWVLGIRSVELAGRRALVRAGAGIVAGSDPRAELAETTLKLRPVLEASWPGASRLL